MENSFFTDKDGRFFIHFSSWECWKNGLYKTGRMDDNIIKKCQHILENIDVCDLCFSSVLSSWPTSSKVHLSNKTINRQAWLGHAGFCVDCGANEQEGVAAWWKITKEKQDRANSIADYYIKKFEKEYMPNAQKISRNECSRICPATYCMDF